MNGAKRASGVGVGAAWRDTLETQVRYLAVGTSESANRVLSGTGGDLGGGDAPIPEKQLKEAAHAAVELPTVLVGIAVFYNVACAWHGSQWTVARQRLDLEKDIARVEFHGGTPQGCGCPRSWPKRKIFN
jgi:hypothetical protein